MDIILDEIIDNGQITISDITAPLIVSGDDEFHVYIGIRATSLKEVHLSGETSPEDYESDVSVQLERLIQQPNMYALHLDIGNYSYEYQEPNQREFIFNLSAYTTGDTSGATSFTITQYGCESTCTVTWRSDGDIIKTDTVQIGDTPQYIGEEPKKKDPTPGYAYEFTGWSPTPERVYSDTVYDARFREIRDCKQIAYFCSDEISGRGGNYGQDVNWASSEYNNDTGIGRIYCDNCITEIDNSCGFSGQTGLTMVILPDSLVTIGNEGFSDCESLTSVTIPNSVTSIGDLAFWQCFGLTYMRIPNSVTSIGNEAFRACEGLTGELIIPDNVTNIGGGAFEDCTGLTSVVIMSNSITSIEEKTFDNCWSLASIEIPGSVESIGKRAFSHCESLTSVAIPDSVTSIGEIAFYSCYSLTSVTIGDSVTSIGSNAFEGCYSLKYINIPNSVTNIGNWAFYNCAGLTSIEIPDSVTSIGNSAFKHCRSLISAVIGNGVISIGNEAFYICSSLTSVTIPDSVTSIGAGAFRGCKGLTSVTIPNSVTSIGNDAFRNCIGLTSVAIGNGVTSIGDNAFSGCTGLASITCESVNPPTISNGTFDDNILNSGVLHVPSGCATTYRDKGWTFSDIREDAV